MVCDKDEREKLKFYVLITFYLGSILKMLSSYLWAGRRERERQKQRDREKKGSVDERRGLQKKKKICG
jgi:hypothetical protein